MLYCSPSSIRWWKWELCFLCLQENFVLKAVRASTAWCSSLTLWAGCLDLPCAPAGWEAVHGSPGPKRDPGLWAVLGRMLASARMKTARELLTGLGLLEEAKSQLDVCWASGCQQDRCIKSGLWVKFSQTVRSKLLSILLQPLELDGWKPDPSSLGPELHR